MLIAVFSDIHGNYQALDSILRDIKSKKVDKIICLGDAVAFGPDSKKCIELIYENNIEFVLGNHEYACIKTPTIDPDISQIEIEHHYWVMNCLGKRLINKLEKSPLIYEIEDNGKKYLFQHFFLERKKEYPFQHLSIFKSKKYISLMKNTKADYVFYGHYHEGRYDKKDNKKFFCIGSSGCTFDENTFYYLIDTKYKRPKIRKIPIKYNRKEFEKTIKDIDYPDKEKVKKDFFGI